MLRETKSTIRKGDGRKMLEDAVEGKRKCWGYFKKTVMNISVHQERETIQRKRECEGGML